MAYYFLECHPNCYTCDNKQRDDCLTCDGSLLHRILDIANECICMDGYFDNLSDSEC